MFVQVFGLLEILNCKGKLFERLEGESSAEMSVSVLRVFLED